MNWKTKSLTLAGVIVIAAMAQAADVKENYDTSCAKCHGADGAGKTKMGQKLGARDYTDSAVQAALTDEAAFKSIKEGLKDKDGNIQMKAYVNFSDDEIKALVSYMRAFKK